MEQAAKKRPPRIIEKLEDWPGLFIPWRSGDDYWVTLRPELHERWNRLRRGSEKTFPSDEWRISGATRLLRAFERVEVGSRNKEHIAFWSENYADDVYRELAASLGPLIEEIRLASQEKAKYAASKCQTIFRTAIEWLIQDRFPSKANGESTQRLGEVDPAVALNAILLPKSANECADTKLRTALQEKAQAAKDALNRVNKALAAIEVARQLCEEERRLPRKAEVQARLEELGVNFSPKSKGLKGKWADVFARAGLAELPD